MSQKTVRRFKHVRQRDSMQCGVAVLAMICRWYGRNLSLEEVGLHCLPTNEGVSLKGISDAASELGLRSIGMKVTMDQLMQIPLPCILHWNQNHFVVLYKISGNGQKFYIADPGKGKYRCSVEEMEKHWLSVASQGVRKGIAMFFEKGKDFEKKAREYKESRRDVFGILRKYFSGYRRQLLSIALCLLAASLLQLILPFLTQSIVDRGIRSRDIHFIWLVLFGELMIVAGRTATDFIRRRLLLHVSMRVNVSLVGDFFRKLLRLPMSFFDTKLMGDLLQRIGDHGRVQSFLTGQMLNTLFTLLSFIVLGTVLFIYDTLIFLVFMAGSTLYAGWIFLFMRRRRVLDYELFEQQARNQNRTYQFVTSMQEIKLQGCEGRRREEWEESQADLFNVQLKALRLQQAQEAGSIFINELKNILITVLAATSVINGGMTLGAMLAVQYIIGQLNSPVEQLMGLILSLQDVRISLERINEVHGGQDEEPSEGLSTEFSGARGLCLDNVSFRYDRHAMKDTVEDISFEIPEGKVTAIVGASGSGKSTLIKLMLGYYPVRSGRIEIAGLPIDAYSLKWWRGQCGVVMQDGVIFSESIARNIAVGDGEIDEARLRAAARTACIDRYISGLPLGYDTKIGRDGMGLSQGQRQRILIARAVYKNPEYIFLDEATNSLDASNEREIVGNLAEFYRGRTVVVVAHRLSTVRDADRIVVLDGGKVVEIGDHESLIARRGVYYSLVRNQLELGT